MKFVSNPSFINNVVISLELGDCHLQEQESSELLKKKLDKMMGKSVLMWNITVLGSVLVIVILFP